ncbi:MAG: hypothetical protein QM811_24785 [Pirellulales bacterium]
MAWDTIADVTFERIDELGSWWDERRALDAVPGSPLVADVVETLRP